MFSKVKFSSYVFKRFFIVFFLIFVLVYFFYLFLVVHNYSFVIKNTKYISKKDIENYLNSLYSNKSYIQISTSEIEKQIKLNFEYVDEVVVEKSIIWGYVVTIKELNPKAYIYLVPLNKTFLITHDKRLFSISKIYDTIPVFYFIDEIDVNTLSILENSLISYIDKILRIYLEISQKLNNIPVYFFDRFGNLILEINNMHVKFDLNERFYTIEKQLQIALSKIFNNINEKLEIDVRYRYLIVRKKE